MDPRLDKTRQRGKDLDDYDLFELLDYENISPVELRRIFVLLLRELYSTTDNYGDEYELKHPPIIYSSKKSKKTLDVDLDYHYDPEEVAHRPGIFVGLGPIQFERKAIGDSAGWSQDNSTHYMANFSHTSLNIRHVSTTPDFSYLLANMTAGFLLSLSDMLRSRLHSLGDIQLAQISPIQLSDPEPEKEFKVDVVFKLDFLFAWKSVVESHRLKEVSWKGTPIIVSKGVSGGH